MVRIDSASLNGLRGLAALHVAVGHFFIFSKEPTQGIDFIGGVAMPFFFLISGFVMVVGYGQKRYKPNPNERCDCCCQACDCMNCCISDEVLPSQTSDFESFNPLLYDDSGSTVTYFPTQKFFNKRISRLAPVYYLTNLIGLPLAFLFMGTAFFAYTIFASLFVITSWLLIAPVNGVLWTISTMGFFYCMFPSLIVRLQKLRTPNDFRRLAWKMYWVQIVLFVVVLVFVTLALRDVFAAYFIWRMFPPNRLPVFVMGCCLGYMRILAKKADNMYTDPSSLQPSNRNAEFDHDLSLRPFCVTDNSLLPAYQYGLIIVVGIIFHFVAPVLAFALRIIFEPLVPVLFFDWIVVLTRNGRANENNEKMNIIEKFLRSKIMLFMGRISLSFYACHLLVCQYIGMLTYFIRNGHVSQERGNVFGNDMAIPPWAICIVLPCSIMAGWLVTIFFERPVQKWLLQKLPQDDNISIECNTTSLQAPESGSSQYNAIMINFESEAPQINSANPHTDSEEVKISSIY